MNLYEVIGVALSSAVLVEIIKQLFSRGKNKAGEVKLNREAGQIVLEGEFKVSEFYKEQLQDLLKKYDVLEARLNEKTKEHESCEGKIKLLQAQYQELQRQFTLLKTRFAVEE